MREADKSWRVLIGIALVVAILIVISSWGSHDSAGSTPADERRLAQYACREFVKDSLHDPDSASFDDASSFVAAENAGLWTVIVTGRATNGFNAKRQMQASCSVRHAAGQWTLVSVEQLP